MYQLADLLWDPAAGTVVRHGQDLRLSRLNYATFKMLVERSPAMVTVDELLDTVWAGTIVNEETVKQRIKLLRQAMGDDPASPKYIEVVRGRGYRLVPSVRLVTVGIDEEKPKSKQKTRVTLAALLFTAFILTGWTTYKNREVPIDTPVELVRLAVMPLSGSGVTDNDYEWFIDGIHEELITRLSRIPDIQVRSRASMKPFHGKNIGPVSVSELLDVNWVLEGSVRRSHNEIRITIQLIDPLLDRIVWTESYNRQLSINNLLNIQTSIANRVAEAVRGQLSPAELEKIQRLPTLSLEAYDAQLLGRFHVFRGTTEDIRIAIGQFQRATELDPAYVRAWEGLGWANVMSGTGQGWRAPRPSLETALEAVNAGLALDRHDASLLNLRESILLFTYGDTERALQAFTQLTEPDNFLPSAWVNLAFVLALRGEFESSLAVVSRMTELFPRDPIVLVQAAWFNRAAGHPKNSLRLAQKALEIDPGVSDARFAASWALYDLGDFEAALLGFKSLNFFAPQILTQGKMGNKDEATALLEQLLIKSKARYIHPYIMAMAYLGVGRDADALTAMESALRTGGRDFLWMTIDPGLKSLHHHPRFQALLTEFHAANGSLGSYQP